jgi:ATPase subunit of ABC transporter with duplicated ATPase domains
MQITDLTVTLSKNLKTIISGFTFTLNPGDKAVIIGEEGNGKSTLIKLLYDPALIDGYASFSGTVFRGAETIGYLPQEFDFGNTSVYEYIFGEAGYGNETEIAELGSLMGIPMEFFYSSQKCSTLSGGEKVKLHLAKTLIVEPDILLLDEPSNDLDLQALEWLEKFIRDCRQAVMFVAHDERLIETAANVIIHLEQVRRKTVPRHTVARLPYTEYIERRERGLEHQEQIARKEKADYDSQMERWRQIYQKVDRRQEGITRQDPHGARLLKKKMHSVKSQGRRLEREADNMTQIPDVEEAIFADFDPANIIPGGKVVLDLELSELTVAERVLARNIRLRVGGPEHIGITGRNGAGKSALLKKIAEMLLPRRDIKAAYMPQNYADLLDFTQTPVEFLAPSGAKDDVTRARDFLGSVKYTSDEMLGAIAELSGGQKAKLLFLKMVLDGCDVLLLDEPTRNFSPLSNPVIRKALREFPGAVICVTHDRKYLSEVCAKVYRLTENGLTPASIQNQN